MLSADLEMEKKEYIISRDDVQLIDIELDDIEMHNLKKVTFMHDKKGADFHIKRGIRKIDAQNIDGIIETNITIREQEEACVTMRIVYKGRFNTQKELSEEEFIHRVYVQMVPQILPYIRSTVSSLSAMLGIPPLVLPTMDVLRSIKSNKKRDFHDVIAN